ncbi:hypothetical protein Tco_0506229 [Tanacetum coccineum]
MLDQLPMKLDISISKKRSASSKKVEKKITVPNGVKVGEMKSRNDWIHSKECFMGSEMIHDGQQGNTEVGRLQVLPLLVEHRVLYDLGLTLHYFRRRSSRNRGSFVSNTTSSGNTFQVLLRVSNGVTRESSRSRGGIRSDKFGKHPLRRLGNLPWIHLEFEELGLDKLELDKQEVEQPEVDRFDLDELGVGKLKLD